jgi:serine/threonine protein kinase
VKRYTLKDIKEATNNFNPNNILGQGGFGIVYKGILHDGTIGAVKRLKDFVSAGENQFHTEVEVISLVVHRNLLNLIGFCSEDNERILVYPYMLNGTVSSKLQGQFIMIYVHIHTHVDHILGPIFHRKLQYTFFV